jgi:hypothetical protein
VLLDFSGVEEVEWKKGVEEGEDAIDAVACDRRGPAVSDDVQAVNG